MMLNKPINSNFKLETLHYDNAYTANINSTPIHVHNQVELIKIAQQQTSKWSPNTILATPTIDLTDDDSTVDLTDENGSQQQPNLDIDSSHIIVTQNDEYDFDITKSSQLHPRHAQFVKSPTNTNTSSSGDTNDDINGENSSKRNIPTQEQIKHVNSHPIFSLLSPHDTEYIQSITQQLASHQSTIDYNHLNPYDRNATSELVNVHVDYIEKYDTDKKLDLLLTGAVKNPFPQSLSLFQCHGVAALLHNHHLLVTAHTGSGKTMTAHALIVHALAQGKKVVYTTPIKALSNQKFAELSRIYPDVGLKTGDTTVNPDASVIVMTTEILRNMSIHTDSPYGAAIFDEVHYMEDMSRGVIWEETLLTLPVSTQMVFLSASVENGDEFAKWIAKVTERPCHVVNTRVRAVPIAHLLLTPPTGPNKPTDKTVCNLSEYSYLVDLPPEDQQGSGQTTTDIRSPQQHILLQQIVSAVFTAIHYQWLPLISFSFVRKDLDSYATQLYKLGFVVTTPKEQDTIRQFCEEHFEADTPNRADIINQLAVGIGVHHSGQIARVREVVETLLERSLIKILFATETFAVGINVPVRTVLFTALSKYDGNGHRLINPSEYTQMSGRAGRRGMDKVGVSIMIQDRQLTPIVYRRIVCGGSLCLESRFRVSIGLLLSSFGSSKDTSELTTIRDSRGNIIKTDSPSTIQTSRTSGGGYTLQQVIENSFAIFRFSNNKTLIANAMLTRAILLYAQLIYKLYQATRNNPDQLKRFLPWLDIEQCYNTLGETLMNEISTISLHTFKMTSLVLDENGCMVMNEAINIREIASVIITPPLLLPLYIQSLALLSSQGYLPISTQQVHDKYQFQQRIERLIKQNINAKTNFLTFEHLYHTILSVLDPLTTDSVTFKPFTSYINAIQQQALLDKTVSDALGTTTSSPTALSTTTITKNTTSTTSPKYNSPLDNIHTPVKDSNLHLLHKKGDPNDVVSYLIPGRVVYIEFPPQSHELQQTDYHLNQLIAGRADDHTSKNLRVPNTLGWSIVVGAKLQYMDSILVDVLTALPVMKGPDKSIVSHYELHVLTLCECSISRISSVTLQIPKVVNLDQDDDLFALWLSLRQVADAWKNFPNNQYTTTQPQSNIQLNKNQYSIPGGITSSSDVNDLVSVLNGLDTASISSLFSMTKFPLIFARSSMPPSGHTDALHRSICPLIELTKNKNPNNEQVTKQQQRVNNKVITNPFQYTESYLSAILFSMLENYPPPLRMIAKLFLDAQACWLSSKVDSYRYTLQLASTSYNNPASTEIQGDDDAGANNDENDENNNSDQFEKTLETVIAVNKAMSDDTKKSQQATDQQRLDERKTANVQSIVAKYFNTVSTMTRYMLDMQYIKPYDNNDNNGRSSSSNNEDNNEALHQQLKSSNTRDISKLLSSFQQEKKGTVCSYIDNPNAIILTELFFDNAFAKLNVSQFAAVCSIFLTPASASDKTPNRHLFPKIVDESYDIIVKQCTLLEEKVKLYHGDEAKTKKTDQQSQASSLLYDSRELGLSMVLPVLTWCETHNIEASLRQAPSSGTIFPGNLARTLNRLLNLLEQIRAGAEKIGDESMVNKVDDTIKSVQQGTLFQSSLHLLEIDKLRQQHLDERTSHHK